MSNTEYEPHGAIAGWIPLLAIKDDVWLGFFNGIPFAGTDISPRRQLDPSRPTPALPLLEKSYVEPLRNLSEGESSNELNFGLLLDIDALLHLALTMGSDYWTQLALTWLNERPATDLHREDLKILQQEQWSSQTSRQTARRILLRRRS